MAFDPEYHHRQSTRLRGYDCSSGGAYFLTLCTFECECLFGEVLEAKMILSDFGKIAEEEWLRSSEIRPDFELDAFVVMPNHLHGIVFIHRLSSVGRIASWTKRHLSGLSACALTPLPAVSDGTPTLSGPLSEASKPPSPSVSTPLERHTTSPRGSAITLTKSSEAKPSSSRPRFTWTVTLERGFTMRKTPHP